MRSSPPPEQLRRFLYEDRFPHDITSMATLPPQLSVRARLVCQGKGVLSGVEAASSLARSAGLRAVPHLPDGHAISPGQAILSLDGPARTVLAVERTLLNLLMHLSGVATATHTLGEAARQANPQFRVAATRKTLPGLRDLEKAAVVHGGGEPHRRDLSDAILVKGTHARLVGFRSAVAAATQYARRHRVPCMVEVHSVREAVEARRVGVERLLLDNLTPAKVREIHRTLERLSLREGVELEATGSITRKNIAAYARSGADLASSGSITHSASAIPFHLVIESRGGGP